jgi:hypothetical protein
VNEINYFKVYILCSGDMSADIDQLHVKKIQLVDLSYIVMEDW